MSVKQRAEDMDTKSILDEVVGLLNVLVVRHIVKGAPAPAWFTKELAAIDFTANTMQSAIDEPEDEDVSFAFVVPA
jgi:hypothetical protein